jgi:hypothetical protein
MNRKQIIVLWIGIAIIVLMCLFPPWVIIIKVDDDLANEWGQDLPKNITIKPYYGFILKPPNLLYSGLDFPFYCYVRPPHISAYIQDLIDWFNDRAVGDVTENAFIDIHLLTIECVIVATIAGGLLFTFTTKAKYKRKEQKSGD